MLTPEYLYYCADDIVALYETLNEKIVRDVVRRLVKTGGITSTARWQIVRLQESGMLYKDILTEVAKLSNLSSQGVTELFKQAGLEAVKYDNQIYSATGLSPIPLSMSPSALSVLKAGLAKTNGYLNNLTLTTANQAQTLYIQLSTLAEMQIESGAFDYVTAIKNAIKGAAEQGAWINYPTGHRDRLDVAVRRAVLTGVGQTTSQMSLSNADEMGCDLVETTAHGGARPSHATWQGKVFSRSGKNPKYPPFSQTGYGSGAGLCGWNCRHSFFPFFEGLSESAYSHEQLKRYENEQVTYNGKKIGVYDASQQQRAMERRIRDTKCKLVGYDEANRNGLVMRKEFNNASVLLKRQEAQLKDFCKQTGLGKQSPRVQTNGFGHSQARKAVWAYKKQVLPNYKQAVIPDEKIKEYALNMNHLNGGRDKAIAFEKALGYNINNADDLISNIHSNLYNFPATKRKATEYGQPFEVKMKLLGPNGKKAWVDTGWIIDKSSKTPRLTSTYLAKEKTK